MNPAIVAKSSKLWTLQCTAAQICICLLNGCQVRKAIKIKGKEKQKSWKGLSFGREFVFANSFPITRHTTEFVSRLYQVKLSTTAMKVRKNTKQEVHFSSSYHFSIHDNYHNYYSLQIIIKLQLWSCEMVELVKLHS